MFGQNDCCCGDSSSDDGYHVFSGCLNAFRFDDDPDSALWVFNEKTAEMWSWKTLTIFRPDSGESVSISVALLRYCKGTDFGAIDGSRDIIGNQYAINASVKCVCRNQLECCLYENEYHIKHVIVNLYTGMGFEVYTPDYPIEAYHDQVSEICLTNCQTGFFTSVLRNGKRVAAFIYETGEGSYDVIQVVL